MTASQITYILKQKGYSANKWQTLEKYHRVGLLGDMTYYMNPLSTQFYFDTSAELLYVRITNDTTKRRLSSANDTVYNNEVLITLDNNKNYAVKVMDKGYPITSIGTVHDIVCFDNIVGFY